MAYEVKVPWIPSLGVSYHIGADGLSVPLIFLTALLTTLGLYYSASVINKRVKEFFALFLFLSTGMFGVFVALDLVLFYVFWEIGLVPMYFLIGIWGREKDRPQYAAIKFFLYTLAGSVFMLLAIVAVYLATGTFDILGASEAARREPGLAACPWLPCSPSGPSSSPSPSKCPPSPSTPGCPMPTPPPPPLARSSWPVCCSSSALTG